MPRSRILEDPICRLCCDDKPLMGMSLQPRGPRPMETPRTRESESNASTALTNEDAAIVARLCEARRRIREEIAKVIVGQESIIDHLLVGLLCRGHILLLGVPGLGKTLMARTLARTLDLEFRRIQFTPDLM